MRLTDTVARSTTGLETIGECLASTEVDEVGVIGSRSRLAVLSTLLLACVCTILLNIGRVQGQVAAVVASIVVLIVLIILIVVLSVLAIVLAVVLSILVVVVLVLTTLTVAPSSKLSIGDSGREEDR